MRLAATVAAVLAVAAAWPVAAMRPHDRPSGVKVTGGEIRASLGGSANSAAYMAIVNAGPAPDQLLSVSCDCAMSAEIHRSSLKRGMMTMAPAGPVPIAAHGRVVFAPGGLHVMLMGVKGRLVEGRSQVMTLRFARAGKVTARFAIRSHIVGQGPAPMGPAMGDMGAMGGMSH